MRPLKLYDAFSAYAGSFPDSLGWVALSQHEDAAAKAANLRPASIHIGMDDSGTASWVWTGAMHDIKMGRESTLQLKPALRGNYDTVKRLAIALLNHECCHGLYTSRTAGDIAADLAKVKVPFRLFNLLEDARIEHLGRAQGIPFGWDDIGCQRDAAVVTPAGLFFAFVASEASAQPDPTAHALRGVVWCGARQLPDGRDVVPLVAEFYDRACNAATSEDAAQITKEWVAVFGMDYLEVPVSVGVAVGAVADKGDDWVRSLRPSQRPGTVNHPGWCCWQDYIQAKPHIGQYIDRPAVDRIKASMRALLNMQEHAPDLYASEGSRLNLGGIMAGEPEQYWQVTKQRADGRRRVLLVVDMSGSMQTFWAVGGGREFALAMIELGQAGDIELRVFLSGMNHRAEMPVHGTRAVDIISLHPNGGDSMECTLTTPEARQAIEWASTVIVWTDGDLNAGQRVGHSLAAAGVRFLACSTCEDKRAAMLSHFPIVAVAAEAAIVAAKVAELILEADAEQAREEGL